MTLASPLEVQTSSSRGAMLAAGSLWWREVRAFVRQRGRIIGVLAPPVLFWLMLGSGFNQAIRLDAGHGAASAVVAGAPSDPAAPGLGYMALFFPGTVAMIVVFTTIFTAYSVIEDRRAGFLQGVLVSPAPRLSIALGKIGGGAVLATLQGILLLVFWPVVGPWPGWLGLGAATGMLALIAVMMTSIGFCLAWPMSSSAGFHAVLNLTIFPMWLLSGAVFPYGSAAGWLKVLMILNPLTYAQAAFAASLYGARGDWRGPLPSADCAIVALLATAGLLWLAVAMVGRRRVQA